MKIPGACAHIASLKTVAPAKRRECEECVKTGSEWVHLRTCQTCSQKAQPLAGHRALSHPPEG